MDIREPENEWVKIPPSSAKVQVEWNQVTKRVRVNRLGEEGWIYSSEKISVYGAEYLAKQMLEAFLVNNYMGFEIELDYEYTEDGDLLWIQYDFEFLFDDTDS